MAEERKPDPPADEDERPLARRKGRDGSDPESKPGEFADDMRTNRMSETPEPKR